MLTFLPPAATIMRVVACPAPVGLIEPAPLTSLPLGVDGESTRLSAFWAGDDAYYVCAQDGVDGTEVGSASVAATQPRWFRIELPAVEPGDQQERLAIARMIADVIPMGGGRVAFPTGSTGRTVYRVWRSRPADRASGSVTGSRRTRILGVRAGRSLRRPA